MKEILKERRQDARSVVVLVDLTDDRSADQTACIDKVVALECGKVIPMVELRDSLYLVAYLVVVMAMM